MQKIKEENEILSDYVEELEKQVKDYQKDLLTCYTDLINMATELTEKDDEIARLKKQLGLPSGISKTHELKCLPMFFNEVEAGRKLFEVRENDRPFAVGDTIILLEYDNKLEEYTGRQCSVIITYILIDDFSGVQDGYCVLGIAHKQEMSRKSSQEKTLALHPCPACGDTLARLHQNDIGFLVACPTCRVSTDKWVGSLGEAVELWNRTIVKTKDEPYRS